MEKGDWRRGCIEGREEGKAEVEGRGGRLLGGGSWVEDGVGSGGGNSKWEGREGRDGSRKKEAGGRREEGEEEGSS